jgi:hypothetical protein
MGLALDILGVEVPFAANALGVGEGLLARRVIASRRDRGAGNVPDDFDVAVVNTVVSSKLIRLDADGV